MKTIWFGLLAFALPSMAWAVPSEIAQEGLIVDAEGEPLDGRHDIRVRLYAQAQGGNPLFEEQHEQVEFFQGYYFVAMGSQRALTPSMFSGDVWLGVTLGDGDEMAPRTRLRKVPAAFVADVALDVSGAINPDSVNIGGNPVIDAQGRWVGDPTNLRGPPGPIGPAGERGPQGPAGAEGGDGSPDTPDQVKAKLVQVDGAGSGVDADLLDGLHADRFMRTDRDTGTTGNLTTAQTLRARNVALTTGDGVISWIGQGGGIGAANAGAIRMGNRDISGVNRIYIDDPGPSEGMIWNGSSARVVVSPLDGSNTDGFLRLQNGNNGISLESPVRITGNLAMEAGANISLRDRNITGLEQLHFNDPGPDGSIRFNGTSAAIYVATLNDGNTDGYLRLRNGNNGISLESHVRTSSDLWVGGRLGVGTTEPASRVELRDDSAVETGLTVRNFRAGGDASAFIRLMGLTAGNQGAWGMIRSLAGEAAGGNENQNTGGLQMVVSTGGAATPNPVMTIQHDGDLGLGTETPLNSLHLAKPAHINAIFDRTDTDDFLTAVVGSSGSGFRFSDSNFFFIGSEGYGSRNSNGTGTEHLRIRDDGNVGIGTTSPNTRLDVNGVIRGPAMTSNRTPQGWEHNILFNAPLRYRVSQTGPASFSPPGLFDGNMSPQYPGRAPTPNDPHVVLIEDLPNQHTQAGAWVGWTTRYWPARRFKIEGFNVYANPDRWDVLADFQNQDYSGSDFMVKTPHASYTKLRFTFYQATGAGGRIGVSELFFIHPEATTPYAGLLQKQGSTDCQRPSISANEDIGAVLAPFVSAYDCVYLQLAANTTYRWNTPLSVPARKDVTINGAGWSNGANNITSIVEMTTARTVNRNNVAHRCINRLVTGRMSTFNMHGVYIRERINDGRPLYQSSTCRGLFNVGESSVVTLQQLRGEVSEDVVNFYGHQWGRAKFGWTFINKTGGSPRDVFLVKADSGWNFAGHGGVVSRSHTGLGNGVSYQDTTRITYLP